MNQIHGPGHALGAAPLQSGRLSRLLVVAAGHIGNSIFCTPAIRLLRRALPLAAIDVVALNAASAAVFEGNDAISSVFVVRWPWRMSRLAAHYDHVVCLHPKSAELLARVEVPVSVIPPFDSQHHHAEQILAFASALTGLPIIDGDRQYQIATLPPRMNFPGQPRIGIHLGCGRTAIHGWKFFYRKRDCHPKLWPMDYYAELAQRLRQVFPDAVFVLTGTRNEKFLARRFAKALPGVIDMTGKTSVVELAGLIGELDLFITQDCGVLHVAASTATPLLALFGPTCSAITGPWPPAAHQRILQGASMAEITPQMAAQAAADLLQLSSRQAVRTMESQGALAKLLMIPMLCLPQSALLNDGYTAFLYAGLL